jgi:hypothetical protein
MVKRIKAGKAGCCPEWRGKEKQSKAGTDEPGEALRGLAEPS